MKLALVMAVGVAAALGQAAEPVTNRPAAWAVRLEKPGLPNFHKVSDTLYRGAQPSREGMRQLHRLGIKTIVNLRSFHSDRDEIGDLPLQCEHIWFKAWHPEDKEVRQFLKIITDPNNTPVFVHCQHGADRTGMMCAIYRMAVEGWTPDQAIAEMTQGGFGFHSMWKDIVRYVQDWPAGSRGAVPGTTDRSATP